MASVSSIGYGNFKIRKDKLSKPLHLLGWRLINTRDDGITRSLVS